MTSPAAGRAEPARAARLASVVGGAVRLTWQADRRNFLVAAGLQTFGALSPTVLVLLGQILLRDITRSGDARVHLSEVAVPVILLALVTALTTASTALNQQQQRLMGERVSTQAWQRVLDLTGQIRLEMFESPRFYDQLERVKNNSFTQHLVVTSAIFGLLGGTVGVLGLLAVLATTAPLLVPLLLLAGIPSILLARYVSRLEFGYQKRTIALYRARGYLRQVLTGRDEAKEVRVFAASDELRRRHDARAREYDELLSAHTRRRQRLALADIGATGLLLVLALGFIVVMLSSGRLSLAAAAASILAVRFVSTSLNQLFRSVGSLFESATYLTDLDEFLALRHEADAPPTNLVTALRDQLCVEDVSFTYPSGAGTVLDHVTMRIRAGEIVALVGENGSGKTTLAKLVAGLYRPLDGRITWDGRDTAEVSPVDVRAQVSVIFQDFVRYQLSALDNIGLGSPEDATDLAAARYAADRAGAARFIERLPLGFDTILSKQFESGQDLSMGQWQRVALARALRKNSSLVVLDEPSASMDPVSEAALFADIKRTLDGRAALLISHRFSSVRLADHIYVLERGRIVEAGTHIDLMDKRGLYAEMFRVQARAYQ